MTLDQVIDEALKVVSPAEIEGMRRYVLRNVTREEAPLVEMASSREIMREVDRLHDEGGLSGWLSEDGHRFRFDGTGQDEEAAAVRS